MGTLTGLKIGEMQANVQRKTLKDFQKALRTIAQDHSKRFQENLGAWKQNMRKYCMSIYREL